MSREVGLPAVLAYQRRQLPTLVGGLRHVRLRRLVGPPLHEPGPSGVLGSHPRQRPPSGSAVLITAEPWTRFDDPWLGRPICLSAFPIFSVRQRWRDGVAPVLMAGWSIGTVESRG